MKAALALWCMVCALGCSKKAPPPHRTEPWLAHPSASASASGLSAPRVFHFTADSSIRFTLVGKKGTVRGRFALETGTLRLDPRDLKSSSASIDIDLTQLSIDAEALPEGVQLGGSTPNALALQWLELGPDVAPEKRRQLANARFELAALENASATVLDLRVGRGQDRLRATVVGTLLLHGFRAPLRCDVFLTALPTATGTPARVSIRNAGPLVIALAPHDIVARGPSGIADGPAMARSADWVGKHAKVEFELVAEAEGQSPGPK